MQSRRRGLRSAQKRIHPMTDRDVVAERRSDQGVVRIAVCREGGKEHLFFHAEVQPPLVSPEFVELAPRLLHGVRRRPGEPKGDRERLVMITGEPVQARIPFHVGPLSPFVYAAATASPQPEDV
jgi:hypothetical protein